MCLRMAVLYKFIIIERALIEELRVLCVLNLVIYCFMLVLIYLSQFNLFNFIFPLVLHRVWLMPSCKWIYYSRERNAVDWWLFESWMDAFQGNEKVHLFFERLHDGEGVEGLRFGFGGSDLLFMEGKMVFRGWRRLDIGYWRPVRFVKWFIVNWPGSNMHIIIEQNEAHNTRPHTSY